MINLEKKEDYEKFIHDNKILFVIFYATWCPQCSLLKNDVIDYCKNNPDFPILFVNIDVVTNLHKELDIHYVPTVLCYKNDKVIKSYIEKVTLNDITATFAEFNA
jgi:thiol-disulfide isomerase/thioredoxin